MFKESAPSCHVVTMKTEEACSRVRHGVDLIKISLATLFTNRNSKFLRNLTRQVNEVMGSLVIILKVLAR